MVNQSWVLSLNWPALGGVDPILLDYLYSSYGPLAPIFIAPARAIPLSSLLSAILLPSTPFLVLVTFLPPLAPQLSKILSSYLPRVAQIFWLF